MFLNLIGHELNSLLPDHGSWVDVVLVVVVVLDLEISNTGGLFLGISSDE